MKKIIIAAAFITTSTAATAATGFLAGERVSGMNKICYYDVLGSTAAITIGAVELCPLTVNF